MITWLRWLNSTNPLVGVPLAAAYLFVRYAGVRRKRFAVGIALIIFAMGLLVSFPCSLKQQTRQQKTASVIYAITDLGALPDGNGESWAADINESGQIVGSSYVADGKSHAFLWKNGILSDLGALDGGYSNASAINDAGVIVGSASNSEGLGRAVVWHKGEIQVLDVGGARNGANGVNNQGQIVGYLGSVHNFGQHAFLWQKGGSQDIGGFIARSINVAGEVVGDEADVRTSTAMIYRDGKAKILPLLNNDDQSRAYAINNNGRIAGWYASAKDRSNEAVLWEGDKIHRLGTLGGRVGVAHALNNRGQVVGTADTAAEERHAFLWENDKMTNLNTLLPKDSGWVLISASGINERGQIVGRGEHNGLWRAFLLTPEDR